jgi:hypothetical protein
VTTAAGAFCGVRMTAVDSYSVIGAARRFALGGLATRTRVQDLLFGVMADPSDELIIGVRHQRACIRVCRGLRRPVGGGPYLSNPHGLKRARPVCGRGGADRHGNILILGQAGPGRLAAARPRSA